jgi:hypothetical protein
MSACVPLVDVDGARSLTVRRLKLPNAGASVA